MDLSTVEQSMANVVEQTGDLMGRYLLGDPLFGAVVREQMQPVIRESALMYGNCLNAAAVMADATQPIALES